MGREEKNVTQQAAPQGAGEKEGKAHAPHEEGVNDALAKRLVHCDRVSLQELHEQVEKKCDMFTRNCKDTSMQKYPEWKVTRGAG